MYQDRFFGPPTTKLNIAYAKTYEAGHGPFNAIDKQIWREWSDKGLYHSRIDDAYPILSIDLVTASKVTLCYVSSKQHGFCNSGDEIKKSISTYP